MEAGAHAPGRHMSRQEPAAGPVDGVRGQDLITGPGEGGDRHGHGRQTGRHQTGPGRALQIRQGRAQLAGRPEVLDAVDRTVGRVPHQGGAVVEQGRAALDRRIDRATPATATGRAGDESGTVGLRSHEDQIARTGCDCLANSL